jgi:hypothetical protein
MRLEELREDARDWWLEARLESGGHHDVLADAEVMVREAPVREQRWHMLATAQYRSGRQAGALATLRRARGMLSDELGLDLGPDLAALEVAVLRHAPELDRDPGPELRHDRCPWPGLAAYDQADRETLLDGDRETRAALWWLEERGVLVVVGPSGCGESPSVRAEVSAALLRLGRDVHVVGPGPRPVSSRRPTLVRSGAAPVVDQAEEAFTLCEDPHERAAFWDALQRYADRAPVIVAILADPMPDLAAQPRASRPA